MKGRSSQNTIIPAVYLGLALLSNAHVSDAADFTPAPQKFRQEIASAFGEGGGLPRERIQLLEISSDGSPQAFVGGRWFKLQDGRWQAQDALAPSSAEQFAFSDAQGHRVEVRVPWREVREVATAGATNYISAGDLFAVMGDKLLSLGWDRNKLVNGIAASAGGELHVASS